MSFIYLRSFRIPGPDVVGAANLRSASLEALAKEFKIKKTYTVFRLVAQESSLTPLW